jgi:tyrocidine synthetase-3
MKQDNPDNQNNTLRELSLDARLRQKERQYWLRQLSGEPVKSHFPVERNLAAAETAAAPAEPLEFTFSEKIFARLLQLSNQSDIRLYIILMSSLAVLLDKYTGNRDIMMGSPIYRQEADADFINKILPLRIQLDEPMTFKQLLLAMSRVNAEAVENINYPMETLPYELDMPGSDSENGEFPLFATAVLVENIHERSYLSHLRLSVIFSFLRSPAAITGKVEYDAGLYRRSTIEKIVGRYLDLLDQVLFNIDMKISAVSLVSAEERQQLVFAVNQTHAAYPQDKTLHRLFAEQAERTPEQIALMVEPPETANQEGENTASPASTALTYRALNEKSHDLAQVLKSKGIAGETIVAILGERSLALVTAILAVLKAGGAYLPIDPEYPADRVEYMLADSGAKIILKGNDLSSWLSAEPEALNCRPGDAPSAASHSHLPRWIDAPATSLAYVIYTSGSTGKPKGTAIQHRSLVNYTWWAAKTYVKNEALNFPLYSSISFDLTVTSIFTPLITGNAIVVYEGTNKDFLIEKILQQDRVGVIKLTPSHLHVIKSLPLPAASSRVRCLIVGGEELESGLAREIHRRFAGQAAIYNEYGPTEATVGCIYHRFNPSLDHDPAVPIGLPADNARVYLLDHDTQPVPPGVSGEIYIAGDGLARGYLNRPELTAARFCLRRPGNLFEKRFPGPSKNVLLNSSLTLNTQHSTLYRTGDLARWLVDGRLEFLGRLDAQVKIRGYRIELGEIEQRLSAHEAVRATVVLARDGKDPYLCAYFVPAQPVQASQLRDHLARHLPAYMVPSFFVPLEEIPLTANGKVNRRALPEPGTHTEQEYVPPQDEIQEKLVELWSQVLRVAKERIGIDANFFELGGHSLKQVGLISEIHKAFHVKIALAEIFKIPTIRGLAKHIEASARSRFTAIEPTEKQEYYPLALPQKRFFIFQQLEPQAVTYNITLTLILEGDVDNDRVAGAFKKLRQQHESLRTTFELIDDEPVQRIHEGTDVEICRDVLPDPPEAANRERQTRDYLHGFVKPFNLSQLPLLRVGLLKTGPAGHLLMVDMHHIITDGISEQIMTNEFIALYNGQALSPLILQYKDYAVWQNNPEQEAGIARQGEFWVRQLESPLPVLRLLTDFPRPARQGFAGSAVDFEIAAEQVGALKALALQQGASLYMVLLALYTIMLSKLSGQEDLIVGTGVVGRTHADLMKIIGLMFNTIPLRNQPLKEHTFLAFLQQLKINTNEAFENQEYPFDRLVEELVGRKRLTRDASRHPLFDTMFAMQNFRESHVDSELSQPRIPRLKITPYEFESRIARFDLFLFGTEINDIIRMRLEYSTALFQHSSAEKITRCYKEILEQVLENREIKLKDITIPISSQRIDVEAKAVKSEFTDFSF